MTKKETPLIFDFLKMKFSSGNLYPLERLLDHYNSRVEEWEKIDLSTFRTLFSKTGIKRYLKNNSISTNGIKDHCELISIYLEKLQKKILDLVEVSIRNSSNPQKNPFVYDFRLLGTLQYENIFGRMLLTWSAPPKDFHVFLMRDFVSFYQEDTNIFKIIIKCKYCQSYYVPKRSNMVFCSTKCQQTERNKRVIENGKNAQRMKEEKQNPISPRYKGKRKDHRRNRLLER